MSNENDVSNSTLKNFYYIYEGTESEKENDEINIKKNSNNSINNMIIEENQNCSLNDKEKDVFIKYIIKFFNDYLNIMSFLLNYKEKIEFPKLDSNELESHIKFLAQINTIYEKIKNTVEDTKKINENLCNGLCDILFGEMKVEDFNDFSFKSEKYTSGGKEQNKRKNLDNNKIALLEKRFTIDNTLKKSYETYVRGKIYLEEKCKIGNYFAPEFDFVIQNIIKGEDINNLPYGWIGIGLNAFRFYPGDGDWLLNQTKKNEWVDGFIGFYKLICLEKEEISSKIPRILRELVFKKEKFKEYEKKVKIKDKRHWRIMEKGIYVYSKIKNAEDGEKGIYLDSKIKNAEDEKKDIYVYSKIKNAEDNPKNIPKNYYLILLNVKVKQDEICEPKNEDIWFLESKFIKIYRILFKKID